MKPEMPAKSQQAFDDAVARLVALRPDPAQLIAIVTAIEGAIDNDEDPRREPPEARRAVTAPKRFYGSRARAARRASQFAGDKAPGEHSKQT